MLFKLEIKASISVQKFDLILPTPAVLTETIRDLNSLVIHIKQKSFIQTAN
jgi:hypothetical protein